MLNFCQKIPSIILILLFLNLQCYDYDLAIIGAGSAGLTAGYMAREYPNKRVVLIEEKKFGGNCIWTADIPSKSLIHLANSYHHAKTLYESRLYEKPCENVFINKKKVLPFIHTISENVYEQYSPTFFNQRGIEVMFGHARFIDCHTLQIADTVISSDKIIIASGSIPRLPKFLGVESVPYLTPDNFYQQDKLPDSIIIVGAGPLGTELSAALSRLDLKVTLIMRHGTILPTFDFEIVNEKMNTMQEDGISLNCNMTAIRASKQGTQTIVACKDFRDNMHTFTADSLFLAINRKPNIKNLGLEDIGVHFSELDGISVDSTMKTNIDNIYACGDVVEGKMRLSRVAYYQAKIAVHNVFCPFWKSKIKASYGEIPKVLYTSPYPLAAIGLTEQDAFKKYGKKIKIYRYNYDFLAKAHIEQATKGLVKFICDDQGILIGAHIVGKGSPEVIEQIKLGERFDEQFSNYFFKTHSSPSYFDILFLAADDARKDYYETNPIKFFINKLLSWF